MSTPGTRYAGKNNMEAASPPLTPFLDGSCRVRGRPSDLKGRYRARYATAAGRP